jgi:hypothetical protein
MSRDFVQHMRRGIQGLLLIAIGATASVIAVDPTEAFVIRYSTTETFVFVGLLLGVSLFALRRWRKDVYGGVEVIVAFVILATSGHAVTTSNIAAAAVGFVGAVYVIVRGMTNFTEGRAERRPTKSRPISN